VDDNQAVLALVVTILERADFRVLSADSGPGALQLAAETTGIIHLLLSDVDMPTLSGPDLASALRRARPDMRVMFMSGGDNGNLLILNYGWAYIQKPFVPVNLVQMVTNVLHGPDRSQGDGQKFDTRKDSDAKPLAFPASAA
jgi:two-component system, cell cycle sensor histidine kinase and response regulator CckA